MKRTDLFVLVDEFGSNIDKLIEIAIINNFHRIVISANENIKLSEFIINNSQEIKKKLEDAQLSTWAISSQIGKVNFLDDFDYHINQLKNTLKVANILNTDNIIINSFFVPQYLNRDDIKNEVIDRLRKIVEICLKAGIYPLLENTAGTFAESYEYSIILYKELPMVKGLLNFSETLLIGEDLLDTWNKTKKHIDYLNIGSANELDVDIYSQKNNEDIKNIIKEYVSLGGKHIAVKPYDSAIVSGIVI